MIVCRAPFPRSAGLTRLTAKDDVEPYLSDAAHFPGGRADEVCFPICEGDVAEILRDGRHVLPVGAQSSPTGGATPEGGIVLSLARMNSVLDWTHDSVRVEAGLLLSELETELRARDLYYPPVPTYDGASVGGTVATNAAGAATFKYGTTRDWVRSITVVLVGGDVLELRRGQEVAGANGCFAIRRSNGRVSEVPVPGYAMPEVRKHSAGYYSRPGMDLIDLFIGAEGTLGVITEVELALVAPRPTWFVAFVPLPSDDAALALVADLRAESKRTWETNDPRGGDVAAIEYIDARAIELLREDGAFLRTGIRCPASARAGLIIQAELAPGTSRDNAFEELGRLDTRAADTTLLRICRILVDHRAFEHATPVLPGETTRRDAVFRLREAVPDAVNRRVRERQRTIDPTITKAGGDVIVVFERLGEALVRYRRIMQSYGLDHAVWGHISDGNLHPNAIPNDGEEMQRAKRAQIEIGMEAIEMGGSPMSEHGVGRSPIKQQLLRRLYGTDGIVAMRSVKEALDPDYRLAPGVLFPRHESCCFARDRTRSRRLGGRSLGLGRWRDLLAPA